MRSPYFSQCVESAFTSGRIIIPLYGRRRHCKIWGWKWMDEAKWIYDTADEYAPYICTACGESHLILSDTCPNCGARMENVK